MLIHWQNDDFTERFDNMNSIEIQREAIIEIVGTQYEGRMSNHRPLFLQQKLVLKHQSDNHHDRNAVLLLTKDGKELGFLPKDYASLYAPAIDSGRYNFSIEIVKAEPDSERPILIVKIISELASHSEKEIESEIIGFVQNIVNGYALRTKEYLTFIYSETVNVDELLSALDKVRLIQKLLSCSNEFIESRGIKPNSDKYTPLTKDSLTNHLSELKADISDVLKQIQKAYNESLDIDDEEEYHRVQSEIRERRKRFRQYDGLLASLLDAVTSYNNITRQSNSPISVVSDCEPGKQIPETENTSTVSEPDAAESIPTAIKKTEPEISTPDSPQLTEQAFFEWLVSEGGVSESTAKQYISNIHSIEKLYQTLFGVRKNLLGTNSADNGRAMIESLIVRNEYIDANERRHNSFGASLTKFAQFAGISAEGLKPPVNPSPGVIKVVDFDNPYDCTYYKPCSFILNELKFTVRSWKELYTKFLHQIYTDNAYSETIKGLVGKSLYGRRIDFADKTILYNLRRPIRVSTNLFAEGNLSAIDIIKRIKCLMELCSIANHNMVIEYSMQEKNNEAVEPTETSPNGYEQLSIPETPEEAVTDTMVSDAPEKATTLNVVAQSAPTLSAVDDDKTENNDFIEWLINNTGLASATAKSYYSSVKTSERIAREQGLKSQRLFDADSYEEARETFRELLQCDAFVKMNTTAHNSLTAGVRKLLQYLDTTKPEQVQVEQIPHEAPIIEDTSIEDTPIEDTPTIASFAPDTTKPFVLKDAVIEILSSEAPEITKRREYKNGISSKSLRELLKEYYGKTIGLFEISKLLMMDKTFKSLGKGCYILNEAMISKMPEIEKSEPVATEIIKEEPIEAPAEQAYAEGPANTGYNAVSYTERIVDTADTAQDQGLTIESILEVIKENSRNLQYEDGFGAYEVKILLSRKGIENVSEEQIEDLMSECSKLQQIEDGYYSLIDNESYDDTSSESIVVEDAADNTDMDTTDDTEAQEVQHSDNDRRIVLSLNGDIVRAYDYSDALSKVCKFSINCKPFKMARIADQKIMLNGKNVFYRKAVPVDGYNKLSNGLQLAPINTVSDLQTITSFVKKYCQIDDNMIAIISQ